MPQTPLLLLSDAPDQSTGLARITRDLASLMCSQPEFRVSTLGLGGNGSRSFPWQQYHLRLYPTGEYEWGELSLVSVWRDFAGETPGIVLTIFDLTRMLWLARPEHVADAAQRSDLMWLRHHIGLWGYFPQDHEGVGGALTAVSREVLMGYDRLLMTSPWGVEVVQATIGHEEAAKRDLEWMPHGLQLHVFKPTAVGEGVPGEVTHDERRGAHVGGGDGTSGAGDRADRPRVATLAEAPVEARDPLEVAVAQMDHSESTRAAVADVERLCKADALPKPVFTHKQYGIRGDLEHGFYNAEDGGPLKPVGADVARHIRIGVVGTNQARKDWGLAAAVCAKLREALASSGTTFSTWWHCDVPIRSWSLPALTADYHLEDVVELTLPPMDDKQMAACYRDCDLTLAIGLGEGFGYPLFESLACGIPVLHGNYASGAGLLGTCGLSDLLIQPKAWRLEGPHNALRPVYNADDWVLRAAVVLDEMKMDWRAHVRHLDWQALGPRFRRWFRDGLNPDRR